MKQEIFDRYVERICKRFKITPEQLFTKTKKTDIVDARHLLYYLCFNRPMKLITIQNYMEDNGYTINHSSVVYGITSIQTKSEEDRDYKKIIKEIEQSI